MNREFSIEVWKIILSEVRFVYVNIFVILKVKERGCWFGFEVGVRLLSLLWIFLGSLVFC